MRSSDGSSDVCSSDLPNLSRSMVLEVSGDICGAATPAGSTLDTVVRRSAIPCRAASGSTPSANASVITASPAIDSARIESRSEERRVGKECGGKCRSRASQYQEKKKIKKTIKK